MLELDDSFMEKLNHKAYMDSKRYGGSCDWWSRCLSKL